MQWMLDTLLHPNDGIDGNDGNDDDGNDGNDGMVWYWYWWFLIPIFYSYSYLTWLVLMIFLRVNDVRMDSISLDALHDKQYKLLKR